MCRLPVIPLQSHRRIEYLSLSVRYIMTDMSRLLVADISGVCAMCRLPLVPLSVPQPYQCMLCYLVADISGVCATCRLPVIPLQSHRRIEYLSLSVRHILSDSPGYCMHIPCADFHWFPFQSHSLISAYFVTLWPTYLEYLPCVDFQ